MSQPANTMQVTEDEQRIIDSILSDILKEHTSARVFVFGSRARGDARLSSDLDLCIDNVDPLPLEMFPLLREAFEQSNLPYTVDIVERRNMSSAFYNSVATDMTPIYS